MTDSSKYHSMNEIIDDNGPVDSEGVAGGSTESFEDVGVSPQFRIAVFAGKTTRPKVFSGLAALGSLFNGGTPAYCTKTLLRIS